MHTIERSKRSVRGENCALKKKIRLAEANDYRLKRQSISTIDRESRAKVASPFLIDNRRRLKTVRSSTPKAEACRIKKAAAAGVAAVNA